MIDENSKLFHKKRRNLSKYVLLALCRWVNSSVPCLQLVIIMRGQEEHE